ncbi:MAG: 4'-phosphopantetheinyl transferase superfamily protein [Desulfobulbaceae bacterium]|nr:4'-phosphopantetheinyl transferase superfamily protein [Desulfobulbaceae bacterium]
MIGALFSAEQYGLCKLQLGAGDFCGSRVGLVELGECCRAAGEEAVAGSYLGASELVRWRAFRLPKRRLEWLGGRIAAKHAAMGLAGAAGPPEWRQWRVEPLASGRPVLAAGVGVLPRISISHSHGLAVALAAAGHCGIDIQQPLAAVLRVRERFCTAGEEGVLAAALSGIDATSRLTLLWAAKEAVRKALAMAPLPGFLEMELLAVNGEPATVAGLDLRFCRHGQELSLAVAALLVDKLGCALTVRTGK